MATTSTTSTTAPASTFWVLDCGSWSSVFASREAALAEAEADKKAYQGHPFWDYQSAEQLVTEATAEDLAYRRAGLGAEPQEPLPGERTPEILAICAAWREAQAAQWRADEAEWERIRRKGR